MTLILLPRLLISSSASVILYLWLKSKFAIFLAIAFSSVIGSANFLDTKDTITAAIKIANPAIKYKKLFEILTLSWIDVIGILAYSKYPLSNIAESNTYVIPFFVSLILLIFIFSSFSIISPALSYSLLVISFICPKVEKKSLLNV